MKEFEQKYGIKEDEKVKDFHRSRRMFCVYNEKLHIAEPNIPYSHAEWFEKERWISKEDDRLMNEITRGIVDDKGDVYFYSGYNFQINEKDESDFFLHLKELSRELDLDPESGIFGGLIKQAPGKIWPSRKKFGRIKDSLNGLKNK